MRRAAFLDRDGVINVDHAYVRRWEDFEFVPGALDAAARLAVAGWTLVVVTNQSGIARGYYTEDEFQALTARMVARFQEQGAPIAAVYHCPHHPSGKIAALAIDCECRKPAPGMLLRATRELGLSPDASIMIGDKPSDIGAARAAGVGRAYLVRSDNAESFQADAATCGADGAFESLADCVDHLLATAA